ncbi:hypothetical protein PM10SUCC1_12030 [Propionigenium maris DSM 9537]|uniref:THIF-type NAD/FAD binding fold domain-containing protein n=1 Tax=Propionigenium maris DSM 9537 TaxID=1123000 RepID=A0A9W6GI93_9FUSO|nr:sulfur carrier protein ThiS adenylyltransferase ThiF [Propionigenium maris]GLI55689.1 hypothetical protein PM10SUCC1_12030 [Propionigenium maris DSM 9537]
MVGRIKKIGIAGAGGLGSNVAVNLVRSGVDNIKVADFDVIDESNLNRQFYFKDQVGRIKVEALRENLTRINPDLSIEVRDMKLDKSNMREFFSDCDIVVEAFDKSKYKSMLLEHVGRKELIVCGSGIGHYNLEEIGIKKMGKNIYIVGDFSSDIKDCKTYSTKVQIVASMMANIVMERGGFY